MMNEYDPIDSSLGYRVLRDFCTSVQADNRLFFSKYCKAQAAAAAVAAAAAAE